MPYSGAQVIIQLIDNDSGDESWYGTWTQMIQVLAERFIKFTFFDREKKIDIFKLELRNDDFAMMDTPVFAKGQKLLMTWGWPGQMVVPRRMIVKKVNGGNPLTVVGYDTVSILDQKKVSRYEESMTESEFVRMIAEEYGYAGQFQHIQETKVRKEIVQNYMTDARMIAQLAKDNSFEFYIDASGLHWHRRQTDVRPVKTYIYRTDPGRGDILSEPIFEANLSRSISTVRVRFRDPRVKLVREVVAGAPTADYTSLGVEDEMGDPEDSSQGRRAGRMTRETVISGGIMTMEEAEARANAMYFNTAKGKYKMKVSVLGDPVVGAKVLVDFYGMSDTTDGLYYVKECEHVVEKGNWTQNLTNEKDALREVKTAKKKARQKKTNPTALEEFVGPPVGRGTLERKLTIHTLPNGDRVAAWMFVDSDGDQIGRLKDLSADEFNALSEREKEELNFWKAQSVQPDAAA